MDEVGTEEVNFDSTDLISPDDQREEDLQILVDVEVVEEEEERFDNDSISQVDEGEVEGLESNAEESIGEEEEEMEDDGFLSHKDEPIIESPEENVIEEENNDKEQTTIENTSISVEEQALLSSNPPTTIVAEEEEEEVELFTVAEEPDTIDDSMNVERSSTFQDVSSPANNTATETDAPSTETTPPSSSLWWRIMGSKDQTLEPEQDQAVDLEYQKEIDSVSGGEDDDLPIAGRDDDEHDKEVQNVDEKRRLPNKLYLNKAWGVVRDFWNKPRSLQSGEIDETESSFGKDSRVYQRDYTKIYEKYFAASQKEISSMIDDKSIDMAVEEDVPTSTEDSKTNNEYRLKPWGTVLSIFKSERMPSSDVDDKSTGEIVDVEKIVEKESEDVYISSESSAEQTSFLDSLNVGFVEDEDEIEEEGTIEMASAITDKSSSYSVDIEVSEAPEEVSEPEIHVLSDLRKSAHDDVLSIEAEAPTVESEDETVFADDAVEGADEITESFETDIDGDKEDEISIEFDQDLIEEGTEEEDDDRRRGNSIYRRFYRGRVS